MGKRNTKTSPQGLAARRVTRKHDNGDLRNSTLFGFDGICEDCRRLYDRMVLCLETSTTLGQKGLRLGTITNVSSESSCHFCRILFRIRWADVNKSLEEPAEYAIYAYSATRILYGRHVEQEWIGGRRYRGDNAAFVVLPDSLTQTQSSHSFVGMQPREKLFLISTSISSEEALLHENGAHSLPDQRPKVPPQTPLGNCISAPTSHPLQSNPASDIFGRGVKTATIDYGVLRRWIRNCVTGCNLQQYSLDRDRFQDVPFRLLDCKTRTLIDVPPKNRTGYVALSYVWGNTDPSKRPTIEQVPFKLSQRCPAVIEDAVEVVLGLGCRYLWVDFLCISSDLSSKHDQIANMDLVYKSADLTIVAAAGDNDEYGLPGVGQRERLHQEQIRLGNHHFVSATSEPNRSIQGSTYHTRGWTLQEYFFSRRRLVFSDTQVFFECHSWCSSVYQQEALHCPQHSPGEKLHSVQHIVGDQTRDEYLRRLPLQETRNYNIEGYCQPSESSKIERKPFNLIAFERHVSEYTKRQLSFDNDSLQAVSSILDRFKEEYCPLNHYFGLPFSPETSLAPKRHSISFKYGLLWTHGPDRTPRKKRWGFPSWSWTGWEGQVDWLCNTTNVYHFIEVEDPSARFRVIHWESEDQDSPGQPRPVEVWRPRAKRFSQSCDLYFAASAVILPLNTGDDVGVRGEKSLWVKYQQSRSRVHVTDAWLIDELYGLLPRRDVYGIPLAENRDIGVKYVLLVQQYRLRNKNVKEQRYYTRVGVVLIPNTWDGWAAAQTTLLRGILY